MAFVLSPVYRSQLFRMADLVPVTINSLKDKMVNVTLQGTVKKLTDLLSYTRNKGGKYFAFYLHENAESSIRLSAYNQCAEKSLPLLKNDDFVRITKISVRESEFNNVKEMQGSLTPYTTITKIDDPVDFIPTAFIPLGKVADIKRSFIDVLGIIIGVQFDVERIMKDGSIKNITVVTLKDSTAQVDVTFWDHAEKIKNISTENLFQTCIALENVTVNHFQGAITLNVSKSTSVTINPDYNEAKELQTKSFDNEISFNLSQRSETSINEDYSKAVIITAIKRDIQKLNEEEEELKLKKFRLQQELKFHENV